MSTPHEVGTLSAKELSALHDLARRRAQELRREAIGDFWRGADAVWAASLATTRRSAERLAYRLEHHAQQRLAYRLARHAPQDAQGQDAGTVPCSGT